MKMRAESRVLLTIALMLSGGLGCGEASPEDGAGDHVPPPIYEAGTQPVAAGGSDSGTAVAPSGQPPSGQPPSGQPPSGQQPAGRIDAGSSTTASDAGNVGGKTDAASSTGSDASGPTSDKDAGAPAQGDASSGGGGPVPAVDKIEMKGPFTPTHITNGGPKGSSWVFYPMELGKDGLKHPVFNWGPGAGTGPSQYMDHLNMLASHGFVVISQPSSGTGADEIPALDWIIAQNEKSGSTFYQKLDTKKVGAGGHSKGALTTMAMAKDPRLTLYILVCGGGGGGAGAANIHAPTVILGGDSDIGTPNFDGDYAEIKSPVVFLTKNGTDHIACARNNLNPWVAFMRWHFYGEEKWKPSFLDGGEYCKTPWKCKSKGF